MKFVPRNHWGARPPVSAPTTIDPGVLKGIALHYTGTGADEQSNHENCALRVKATQDYHIDTQGWNDIAYTHLVCKHGFVFKGRGWGVQPAATAGQNRFYHAVCFLGNDSVDRDDVTKAGRLALREILDQGLEMWPDADDLKPHSHFNDTSCPGDQLRAWLVKFAATL